MQVWFGDVVACWVPAFCAVVEVGIVVWGWREGLSGADSEAVEEVREEYEEDVHGRLLLSAAVGRRRMLLAELVEGGKRAERKAS